MVEIDEIKIVLGDGYKWPEVYPSLKAFRSLKKALE